MPKHRDPAAIRPVFRVLAWILAPFMMVGGVVVPAAIAWMVIQGGGNDWTMALPLISSLIGIPAGRRLLFAARTGRDPFVVRKIEDPSLF